LTYINLIARAAC